MSFPAPRCEIACLPIFSLEFRISRFYKIKLKINAYYMLMGFVPPSTKLVLGNKTSSKNNVGTLRKAMGTPSTIKKNNK